MFTFDLSINKKIIIMESISLLVDQISGDGSFAYTVNLNKVSHNCDILEIDYKISAQTSFLKKGLIKGAIFTVGRFICYLRTNKEETRKQMIFLDYEKIDFSGVAAAAFLKGISHEDFEKIKSFQTHMQLGFLKVDDVYVLEASNPPL